jgi:asparagine synthase (glutamine-hydrolysing)
MCGILGISQRDKKDKVISAIETFRYRGPDDIGVYSDDTITFSNVRLSVIDPLERSNQPMFDDSGEIGIVYNGEIFNYKEIKSELEKEFDFKTDSDTETIIYAYKKYGINFLEKLNGMFALCIYDKREQKLILARDSSGIKPLYYHKDSDGLLSFSSEIKGIIKMYGHANFKIDESSLVEFMHHGFIRSPNSLYKDIHKVERSTYVEYHLLDKKLNVFKYHAKIEDLTDENLDMILERSILRHLESDVPVGLFLSGGVDSSVIASYLHKNKVNLKCFSVLLSNKDLDKKYTEIIEDKLGLDVKYFKFGVGNFDQVYEYVMPRISEPHYDYTVLPTYFISKHAQKEVKVVISGSGGDEYFMGYPRHLGLNYLNKYRDYRFDVFDYLYCVTPKFFGKKKIFEKVCYIFKKPFSFYLLTTSLNDSVGGWKKFKEYVERENIEPINLDSSIYLENNLLHHLDVATSFASVEGRVPLLDVEIIAKSKLLADKLIVGQETKVQLKSILEKFMPKSFVYRKKSGFGMSLDKMFEESIHLKKDLIAALEFLKSSTNIDKKLLSLDPERIKMKDTPLAFAIISLYYSIKNNSVL